jgi:hypothetical protein
MSDQKEQTEQPQDAAPVPMDIAESAPASIEESPLEFGPETALVW